MDITSPVSANGALGCRSLLTLLMSEARTKPHIAHLVATVPMMTEDEFTAIAVPLPWYRKALTELRQQDARKASQEAATVFVEAMGDIVENAPQRGIVARYTGPDTQVFPPVRHRGGNPLSIEVKTGDIIFITPDETWLGSIPMGHPNIPHVVIAQDATRSDYFSQYERSAPSVDVRHTGEMHESGLFRISR